MQPETVSFAKIGILPGGTHDEEGKDYYYLFAQNGRKMTLTIPHNLDHEAHTTIQKTFENRNHRTHGVTTALFIGAREIMETSATERDKPIHYLFETQDAELRKWAMNERLGNALFRWREVNYKHDLFVARATIYQKTSS
jgi:hypothetical protein